MKRSWDGSISQPPPLNLHEAATAAQQNGKDAPPWSEMNSHPYASAYANMAGFPGALPGGAGGRGGVFDAGAFAATSSSGGGQGQGQPELKRPRTSNTNDGTKDGDSDDDDDDDDDSDDDDQAAKLAAAAAKPNRKIVKGPDGKPKVKLTRGSRACIA